MLEIGLRYGFSLLAAAAESPGAASSSLSLSAEMVSLHIQFSLKITLFA